MKLQLDTVEKTITIDQDVNLGDLVKTLNSLLPKKQWKEYKLTTNTVVYWQEAPTPLFPNAPIQPYYESPGTLPDPNFPWVVTCGMTEGIDSDSVRIENTNLKVAAGTYAIEVNL